MAAAIRIHRVQGLVLSCENGSIFFAVPSMQIDPAPPA
jgi:hypothetical protein